MKSRFWLSSIFALFILAGLPNAAQAQTSFALGPRVGIGLGDYDDPYIGADVRINTPALPVQLDGTFDYYFVSADNTNLFRFTANALYPFGIDNKLFTPYVGAGVSIARISFDVPEVSTPLGGTTGGGSESDTDTALNVLGGALFDMNGFNPFVQADFTLGGDADLFGITGGLLFEI